MAIHVYIVKGSEDGVLGVYGSKKKAHARCIEYLLDGASDEKIKEEDIFKDNQEFFCTYSHEDSFVSAEWQKFTVE